MIDWAHIRALRDEIGADAFEEVVELFVEEVEAEIEVLRATPAPPDLEAQLHFIKGSALNLGFAELSRLCQRGEAAAAKGQADGVNVARILDCFERSRTAFLAGLRTEIPVA